MEVGIITYNSNHLKTEQIVLSYSINPLIKKIMIFAMPFVSRNQRVVSFQHRPNMMDGMLTSDLSALNKVSFFEWDGKENLSELCDVFIIGGAGLLDIGFAGGKPIVNAHPGIIPLTRGLDSLKWAILNNDPIGITLHLIDNEVDAGKILHVARTSVFPMDTFQSICRRHYEYEILLLSHFLNFLNKTETKLEKAKPATRRMNIYKEKQMLENFELWKSLQIKHLIEKK